MKNILYLDDCINLYTNKLKKIITYNVYKDTLCYGIIANKEKFINCYKKMLKEYGLKNRIVKEDIVVIINSFYTLENKLRIIEILEELNYRNIITINDIELLNIKKNELYIMFNYNYYSLHYSEYGKVKSLFYKNNIVNKEVLFNIINKLNKENIFIFGKNSTELESQIKSHFYSFEDYDNLLISLLLNKNVKF